MTPLQIEMLIWYAVRAPEAGSFPGLQCSAQIEAVTRFIDLEVFERTDNGWFNVTERGYAWLAALKSVPTPVARTVWVNPNTQEEIVTRV